MTEYVAIDGIGKVYVSKSYLQVASVVLGKPYDNLLYRLINHYANMQQLDTTLTTSPKDQRLLNNLKHIDRVNGINRVELSLFRWIEQTTIPAIVEEYIDIHLQNKYKFGVYWYENLAGYLSDTGMIIGDLELLAYNWRVPLREVMSLERATHYKGVDFMQIIRNHYANSSRQLKQPQDRQVVNTLIRVTEIQTSNRGYTEEVALQQPVQQRRAVQQPQKQVAKPVTQPAPKQQLPQPKPKQPSVSNTPFVFDRVQYSNLEEATASLGLNKAQILQDIKSGKPLQEALYNRSKERGLQLSRSNRETSNAMFIYGHYFPNLQEACERLQLNLTEVSYYKSNNRLSAQEAVYAYYKK